MPMLKKYNPEGIVKPFASYSQGVEVPPNARWLHIAGQVGVNPDGTIAGNSEKQVERAWQNVLAVLAEARYLLDGSPLIWPAARRRTPAGRTGRRAAVD